MKKLLKTLTSRMFIVILLLVLQFAAIAVIALRFSSRFVLISIIAEAISLLLVVHILRGWANPGFKIAWILVVLVFPAFGALMFLLLGNRNIGRKAREKMIALTSRTVKLFFRRSTAMPYMEVADEDGAAQSRYLEDYGGYPVYRATGSKYYPSGEDMFPDFLTDLSHAKRFIFMEYFIINKGEMWDQVLGVLKERAAAGVDVRLIYDDFGCLSYLPVHYAAELEKAGIHTHVFNPVFPTLDSGMNNRDHRKICVIDGNVGYTGGINLADEYINKKRRFGYWKDTAVRLHGDGVWSLTIMFLTMWSFLTGKNSNFEDYRPSEREMDAIGYVQPFADAPVDRENVAENAYLNMISRARRYVYITTPYLVLDNEMRTALCNAAKSGLDIRIFTPAIPDKKTVFQVTRQNYEPLLNAGVKIYEFTPGFVHAKSFVADDKYAIVGTINLDYRSLYLNFENGVFLCGTESVTTIRDDLLDMQKKSRQMTLEASRSGSLIRRFVIDLISVFSPMM